MNNDMIAWLGTVFATLAIWLPDILAIPSFLMPGLSVIIAYAGGMWFVHYAQKE